MALASVVSQAGSWGWWTTTASPGECAASRKAKKASTALAARRAAQPPAEEPRTLLPQGPATLVVANDEGAPVRYGEGATAAGRLYCGRSWEDAQRGTRQCGPDSGPQCDSCRRFQEAREGASRRLVREAPRPRPASAPGREVASPVAAEAGGCAEASELGVARGCTGAQSRAGRERGGGLRPALPPCMEEAPSPTAEAPADMAAPQPTAAAPRAQRAAPPPAPAAPSARPLPPAAAPAPAPLVAALMQAAGDLGDEPQATSTMSLRPPVAGGRLGAAAGVCGRPVPPPQVTGGAVPLEPRSGSAGGGARLQWTAPGTPPEELLIAGRPCAALSGGAFVAPMCRGLPAAASGSARGPVDVVAIFEEAGGERRELYPRGFAYWSPGEILAVEPPRCPLPGGAVQVRVRTTDLGAAIASVSFGGAEARILSATSAEALVAAPAYAAEGAVVVEVSARNGNGAAHAGAFSYYAPEEFGLVGEHAALSDSRLIVTRLRGVNRCVCIGAFPLRRVPGGRYFAIRVEDVCRSLRTLAVGVAARPGAAVLGQGGRLAADEAHELGRVWLAGYDRAGAVFIAGGAASKIPAAAWRPVACLARGSVVGVLWTDADADAGGRPALVIFQDGRERVRLPLPVGHEPDPTEELFAVVDVQGSVSSVALLPGAMPPRHPSPDDGAAGEAMGPASRSLPDEGAAGMAREQARRSSPEAETTGKAAAQASRSSPDAGAADMAMDLASRVVIAHL